MNQIDVTIMGQSYKLACKEEELNALKQAAAYLDEKMCDFRDATKIKGDKIAVMTALKIAVELLEIKAVDGPFSDLNMAEINKQIQGMNKVIDSAINVNNASPIYAQAGR